MFLPRKSARTPTLLLCVSLGLFTLKPIKAAAPAYHIPSAGLTVQAEPNLRLITPNEAEYDSGHINFLDTPTVEHTFTLRNEGATPLTITQLSTTCHCTSAALIEVAGRKIFVSEEPVFALPPGLDMKIKLTVQLVRQVAGRVTQGVYVFANGYNAPIAHLQLCCELAMGISVSPIELDFGLLQSGETKSREIAIAYDDRLVSGTALPPIQIQCDPQIIRQTGSIIAVVPKTESTTPAAIKPTTTLRIQTYTVTVKPTQSGNLVARLFFAPVPRSDYKGSLPYDTAMDVFRTMTVAVLGHVTEKQ